MTSKLDSPTVSADHRAIASNANPVDIYTNERLGDSTASKNNNATQKPTDTAATKNLVKSGTLPALSLEHPQSQTKPETHWYSGALNVAEDLGKGAINEITQHPGHVVASALMGAGVGVGMALLPEMLPVVALVGAGAAVVEGVNLYEHRAELSNAIKTVANSTGHSPSELAHANSYVQKIGAGTVDFIAGIAGSGAGFMTEKALASMVAKVATSAASAEVAASTSAGSGAASGDGITAAPIASSSVPPEVTQSVAPAAAAHAVAPEVAQSVAPAAAQSVAPEVTQPIASAATPPVPTDAAAVAPASPVTAPESTVVKAATRPRLADMEDDEPPTPLFTPESTTMSVKNPGSWQSLIDKNGHSELGSAILGFTNKWATLMESQMAAGAKLSPAMADAASREADLNYGLSGGMYNYAERALYDNWTYGATLEQLIANAK